MSAQVVQIGLCTADVASTVRRYCEGFGFQDAGARIGWGARQAQIQGLGDDTTNLLWWLVGRQAFLNLEFFYHSLPRQRPLPGDWRPSDLGWVRWGFAVTDFDRALAYLDHVDLSASEIVVIDGLRRLCFRDPDLGVFVEVLEDGQALPGFSEAACSGDTPRILYATLSVDDLAVAQEFYAGAMELAPFRQCLHTPEMEALWGLPGAKRQTVLLDGGRGMFIELVAYEDPPGRFWPDRRLCDQGMMNVALGWHQRAGAERALARAVAAGATSNALLGTTPAAATYVNDPLGNSLELLFAPETLQGSFGWKCQPQIC